MPKNAENANDMRAQTKGFGPIILRRGGRDGDGHQHLRMHPSLAAAGEEAKRLVEKEGGAFCVYVPAVIYTPPDGPPRVKFLVNLDDFANQLADC